MGSCFYLLTELLASKHTNTLSAMSPHSLLTITGGLLLLLLIWRAGERSGGVHGINWTGLDRTGLGGAGLIDLIDFGKEPCISFDM